MDIGSSLTCLALGQAEMTWEEAIEYCNGVGGNLWYPDNEAKSTAIYEFFQRLRNEQGKNRLLVHLADFLSDYWTMIYQDSHVFYTIKIKVVSLKNKMDKSIDHG